MSSAAEGHELGGGRSRSRSGQIGERGRERCCWRARWSEVGARLERIVEIVGRDTGPGSKWLCRDGKVVECVEVECAARRWRRSRRATNWCGKICAPSRRGREIRGGRGERRRQIEIAEVAERRGPLVMPKNGTMAPAPQQETQLAALPQDSDRVQIDTTNLSEADLARLGRIQAFDTERRTATIRW